MLISGDTKKYRDPPVKIEVYGGQVINGILAEVWLIVSPGGVPKFILWLFPQTQNV